MWLCIVASVLAGVDPAPAHLAPSVRILARGKPINVDVGHAAPFVADLKGDGKQVLLVGQFGEGKLRLYPNVGTKTDPRFEAFEYLRVGDKVATVPTG